MTLEKGLDPTSRDRYAKAPETDKHQFCGRQWELIRKYLTGVIFANTMDRLLKVCYTESRKERKKSQNFRPHQGKLYFLCELNQPVPMESSEFGTGRNGPSYNLQLPCLQGFWDLLGFDNCRVSRITLPCIFIDRLPVPNLISCHYSIKQAKIP